MKTQNSFHNFLLICWITTGFCFEPLTGFSAAIAGVASLAVVGYSTVKCVFYECCDKRWIPNNVTSLDEELEKHLYGQHLVMQVVTSHIRGHVLDKQPPKALVLSFHGSTGTGKNHVSRIIAEQLYKKGLKSENVHLIAAMKEFPHKKEIYLYKDRLRDMIERNVKKCPQSLFIFDEVEEMPGGLIDTIKPYLDYHEHLRGVDYRRAIFLFLSNVGGTEIMEYVIQRWRDGAKREDIKFVEVENILARSAINSETEGGLWHSKLIGNHLVTAFIPFLPLPREHIQQCARYMIQAKGYYPVHNGVRRDEKWLAGKIQEVMKTLTFYPENIELFSVTGCKRIEDKVKLVMLG